MRADNYLLQKVHGHVPFIQLGNRLDYILSNRVNPELFFTAEALDRIVWEELSAHARLLHKADLFCTIHAPFMDLNPGALDPCIRDVTRKRFDLVFQAAEQLKPKVIVFHPGYDDLRYGSSQMDWLKNSIEFWKDYIPRAEHLGCVIAIENIFEKEPSTLKALLESFDHPNFRHCFDVGHWNMFTTVTMEDWFAELGSYVAECHVHDNHGENDEHLPLGEGEIDFDLLFGLLKHYSPEAVWTLEAHSVERLERALKNIQRYCL